MSNVLITGASSGFGFLTTQTLVKAGHTVFATMRDAEGKNASKAAELKSVAEGASGSVHVLTLDVTDEASVAAAVAKAVDLGGIDVVVNNAGYGTGGWTEAFTPEQLQSNLEVNVVGVHRVNRAVLPHLREKGGGLLIHVSSTLGRMVFPYCGVYTASKYAVEGLAESLRYELATLGIDSVIVEPGGFATNFFANMAQPADEARIGTYGDHAEAPGQFWGNIGEMIQGDDAPSPQLVADAILKLVETPAGERPLRTVVAPGFDEGPKHINQTTDGVQKQMFDGMHMSAMLGPKKG